jgi:2',3'-cyclic-nucleotide 2'-phosphodiesterase (5'-nucleotidase family)
MAQVEFSGVPLGTIANTLVFVQLNDVYQIDAAADYRDPDSLILPRVATVVERLRKRWGDRVHLFVPGDFLAPSAMSLLYKGEQMVDVFNTMGVDLVCIGNHEFDVDTEETPHRELLKRIDESKFDWICSNIELDDDSAAEGLNQKLLSVKLLKLSEGTDVVLIGLLGKMKKVPVASEPAESVGQIISQISQYLTHQYPDRRSEFLFVALTHQDMKDDRELARSERRLHLILGGHDHEIAKVDAVSGCFIAKAQSNVRTIRLNFVISIPSMLIDPGSSAIGEKTMIAHVAEELVDQCVTTSIGEIFAAESDDDPIMEAVVETEGPVVHWSHGKNERTFILSVAIKTDHQMFLERVPCSPQTKERIEYWAAQANRKNPFFTERLAKVPTTLTLQDHLIRSESTNFGKLTAELLRNCLRQREDTPADVGLINGGTFRLGRDIREGEWITGRTLSEIFYYENVIAEYRLSGRALLGLLNLCHERRPSSGQMSEAEGDGQFVQIAGILVACRRGVAISWDNVSFVKSGQPLELDREYSVVTTDYLATKGRYAKLFGKPIREAPQKLRTLVANSLDWMLAEANSDWVRSHGWVESHNRSAGVP